ncbi:DUF3302 domain-containing protein [uncultured Umboniibacter sp.]|uniref:DUF3302 domain-containing protein n=1 Tax=uncultured Umboniibacter sp. TaxID=1798917 RepID=UPI00341EE449
MLEYLALVILVVAALILFYGIIAIHDIPYEISKYRNHPHQDAIHYAGWVSLFTLHVLWPFLWIWATLYREDRGWGMAAKKDTDATQSRSDERIARLEAQLENQQASINKLITLAERNQGAGDDSANSQSEQGAE